jgi:hypothetical protein
LDELVVRAWSPVSEAKVNLDFDKETPLIINTNPLSILVDMDFAFYRQRYCHFKVNGWSSVNQMID